MYSLFLLGDKVSSSSPRSFNAAVRSFSVIEDVINSMVDGRTQDDRVVNTSMCLFCVFCPLSLYFCCVSLSLSNLALSLKSLALFLYAAYALSVLLCSLSTRVYSLCLSNVSRCADFCGKKRRKDDDRKLLSSLCLSRKDRKSILQKKQSVSPVFT